MDEVSAALTVLSAMITPAVLISACGSLAISTANRLGRTIDRTRKVAALLRAVAEGEGALTEEEHGMLYAQLGLAARRARLLHHALRTLYLALVAFVATSVVIGVVSFTGLGFVWLPLALGFMGAILLFYTSVILIHEAALGHRAVEEEMDFTLRLGQKYAPAAVAQSIAESQR